MNTIDILKKKTETLQEARDYYNFLESIKITLSNELRKNTKNANKDFVYWYLQSIKNRRLSFLKQAHEYEWLLIESSNNQKDKQSIECIKNSIKYSA